MSQRQIESIAHVLHKMKSAKNVKISKMLGSDHDTMKALNWHKVCVTKMLLTIIEL